MSSWVPLAFDDVDSFEEYYFDPVPTANAGDLILGSGRPPGAGNGNPLHYSCLGNPMDRGSWRVTVHGVTKNWTQLHTHTGILWEAGCVLRVGVKYSMEGPA